jgi:mannose-6-phosphate isomerase-like protein (cupin superfamily)
MADIQVVNLAQKFSLFQECWHPKIVGELNDSHVKLVKLQGDFVWHHHETEDELFLVVKGELVIHLRDHDLRLGEGEFVIISHGVEHQPVAAAEVWVMLLEPNTTLNTGTEQSERTAQPEWI